MHVFGVKEHQRTQKVQIPLRNAPFRLHGGLQSNAAQSSLLGLYACVMMVYFDVLADLGSAWDETGREGGALPPANDSVQVRYSNLTPLRQEIIMNVDVATKKRKYSPSEVKWQADKT